MSETVQFPRRETLIQNKEELLKIITDLRKKGLRIVLTQGTFDLVHIGHGRYLEAAKEHGDILVVGVDSDAKTKKRKGPGRPLIPQDERLEMLTHMMHVDLVILKEDVDERWSLTKLLRPDVLIAVEGTYTPKEIELLHEFCDKVAVLPRQAETSTSAKIRLMQIDGAHKLAKNLAPKIVHLIETTVREMQEGG